MVEFIIDGTPAEGGEETTEEAELNAEVEETEDDEEETPAADAAEVKTTEEA